MEVPECEICQKVPTKSKYCNVCLCPADIRTHKADLPDCPHHLIPLKVQAKVPPAAPASLQIPEINREESKYSPLQDAKMRLTGTSQYFRDEEHLCAEECQERGICSLMNSPPELRFWQGSRGSFTYYYVTQMCVCLAEIRSTP